MNFSALLLHKQLLESDDEDERGKEILYSFILSGVVGLKDPCRPGVRKAIEDCQYAKVKIKMITGNSVWNFQA